MTLEKSTHTDRKTVSKPQWLRDREVAARVGISRNRVWAWTRIGHLPRPTKLGPNTSRWHVDVIEHWEEEQRKGSES
jgi:predicted DNA-binding transcriptional regulator AlpA